MGGVNVTKKEGGNNNSRNTTPIISHGRSVKIPYRILALIIVISVISIVSCIFIINGYVDHKQDETKVLNRHLYVIDSFNHKLLERNEIIRESYDSFKIHYVEKIDSLQLQYDSLERFHKSLKLDDSAYQKYYRELLKEK